MLKPLFEQLLALTKAGLWGESIETSLFEKENVDWEEILILSDQQTVTGIVTDAITLLPPNLRPSKSIYYLMLKRTDELEKENKDMYQTIPSMVQYFSDKGIQVLLLKGQGVGLCYRNPYHRTSGDVDFFTGTDSANYEKAKSSFHELGIQAVEEITHKKHIEYVVDGIKVEIHGDIQLPIGKQFDARFKSWMKNCLKTENVIVKKAGKNNIYLPPYRFDVVFIFAHALHHYMMNGLGLRQLCDWICYLTKYHERIDTNQLEKDLEYLGLTKFWKFFAAMAVEKLGMKKELMPMYDGNNVHNDRILHHIFSTGNFGHLQKKRQNINDNKLWKKIKTFCGQFVLFWDNLLMFPKETWWCFKSFVINSIVRY